MILNRVYQDYLLMFKIPPEGSCWHSVWRHWSNERSPTPQSGTSLLPVTFVLWIKAAKQLQQPTKAHMEEVNVWFSLSVSTGKMKCKFLNPLNWIDTALQCIIGEMVLPWSLADREWADEVVKLQFSQGTR